jgi:pyruvate/2-oxoglutarate dehydrogenase complex dihydrolipoamide dehydrogenase (E3) component
MPSTENYDILVVGSGEAGKYLAWTLAGEGHRTAVVERELIGGHALGVTAGGEGPVVPRA